MSDIEIKENIISIFRDTVNYLDDDFFEKELIDLGIDSITFIKIIVKLENFFDFEFEEEDLNYQKFNQLNDVKEYIIKKTRANEKIISNQSV